MATRETLLGSDLFHLLDARDFGRRAAPIAALFWFAAAVVLGIIGSFLCHDLGSVERLVPNDRVFCCFRPCPERPAWIWQTYVPQSIEALALVLLVLPSSACGIAILGPVGFRWLRRLRWRMADWRQERMPVDAATKDASDGQRIRVRGQVLPGSGFTTAGGQRSAVLASYFGDLGPIQTRSGRASPRWELYGMDFALHLDTGETITVKVESATLRARPSAFPKGLKTEEPICARPLGTGRVAVVYHEDSIGSGDIVEVVGVVSFEIDPSAKRTHSRGEHLRMVLASAPGAPLLVRAMDRGAKARPV